MNKQVHRLVFDRRRGMRVPAAEHVRSAGKAAGGERRATARTATGLLGTVALLGPLALGMAPGEALAQQRTMSGSATRAATALSSMGTKVERNLPQAYTGGLYKDQGKFTTSTAGQVMNIKQFDDKVIINWDSFNVGQGYTVRFIQPNSTSSALNNIWSLDPSVILGQIQANGEVILQNQNGFIFGSTARVDTGRFVTTALKLANDTYLRGIRADAPEKSATFGEDDSAPTGFITIERGAEIKALAGGDVMMVAPKVYNEGTIETPKGQTILAAGQKVYLYNATDPSQRGLVVAVDAFADSSNNVNTVEQAAAGTYKTVDGATVSDSTPSGTAGLVTKINQVMAEQGTINLVGMTIRQNGLLTATTAVKGQNGAIYLQAQKSTVAPGGSKRVAAELGTVEFGKDSQTLVLPSTVTVKDKDSGKDKKPTQKDGELFYRSSISVMGKDIRVRSGAEIKAVSGNVSLMAAANTQNASIFDAEKPSGPSDGSRLVVESGATISAAGLRNVAVPMSRNQLSARMFSSELADSPVQRGGVLYRSDFLTDARRQVSVANVTGQYNLVERTVDELSTRGGNVRLWSQGELAIADDARIDVSGGSIKYEAGEVMSSLVRRGNQLIALENAKAGEKYDELITPTTTLGTQQVLSYEQGADAGIAWLAGANTYLGNHVLKADVVLGPNQRAGQVTGNYVSTTDHQVLLDPLAFTAPMELGVAFTLTKRPDLYGSLQPLGGTLMLGFKSQVHEERLGTQLVQGIELQNGHQGSLASIPEFDAPQAEQFFADLSGGTTRLVTSDLEAAGISSLLLSANAVSLPKGTSLDLGASGQLTINASHIDLDARVRAAGGKVSLLSYGEPAKDEFTPATHGAIEIGPDARIDLSGTRLDERGTASLDAINVNGGTFTLDADHSASLAEGSVVDVSAGVWRSSGGTTSTGVAGAVKLSVNGTLDAQADPTGQLFMNGTLSGFDFKSGGTLTVSGLHSLAIGGSALDEWGMSVGEGLFSDHGFGTFNLSTLGDVSVLGSMAPVLRNLVLTSSRLALTADAMTTIDTVDATNRQGIALNLAATLQPRDGLFGSLSVGGDVKVAEGITVDVGAAGQIGLTAGGDVEVAGTLVAHGGNISLGLSGERGGPDASGTKDAAGFIDGQEVRLTSTGKLDVSGVALTTKTSTASGELIRGRVLAGGAVKLNVKSAGASRGRVVTEEGSAIDVSGAVAELDLGKSTGARTKISKGAGSVSVASSDGFSLMGTLTANRPDASVSGGQFSAAISREGVADFTTNPDPAHQYKTTDHQLVLLKSGEDVGKRVRSFNEGVLSSDQLLNAGFEQIQLRADERIVLGAGVDLVSHPAPDSKQVPLRSVQLTSPILEAQDAGSHTIQAAYVSLGDRDLKPQAASTAPKLPSATLGGASLSVQAGLIEVYGNSALRGFGDVGDDPTKPGVVLSATLDTKNQVGKRQDGEIRFIGRTFLPYTDAKRSDLQGRLAFGGKMTLQAGQIYASTLSNFTVQGLLGQSSLTVSKPDGGSTSATPLSALAQLALQAADVDIQGVIRQPFGGIIINGEKTPVLGDGSVLSVSGDGVSVPVGTTINSRQWVYATEGTVDGVNPAADTSVKVLDGLPVAKGILVKGAGLSIGDQSQFQAQAGGDLQAWEFIAGVGGTTDTLNRANVFAILPGYHYDFAPYDTEIVASTKAAGTTLNAGDQVQITTGSGALAAGLYTLLPARYATLPGAVLVSASTSGTAATLPQAIARDDGSLLVSGYKTVVGTEINGGNDLRQAFVLEPEATFRAKSALQVSSINAVLADQAKRAGTALPSRPGDAGRISLVADEAFDWSAQFNLKGMAGFEAGQFDLSMPGMNLLASGASASDAADGTKFISVAALNETGASSILLGGVRTGTAEHTRITTLAQEVNLSGAIEVGELIVVATDMVHVSAGTSVKSTAAKSETASTITLDGMGAALVVGNHAQTDLSRDLSKVAADAPSKGALLVDAGVTLEGASVQLDGRQLVKLDASATLVTSAIGVGAPRIALGGVSGEDNTLSVSGALLTKYSQANRLQLRSYSSIDLLGSVKVGDRTDGTKQAMLQSLVLDTPELRGVGQTTDTAELLAQSVVLRNSSGLKAGVGDPSVSQLLVTAEPVLKDGVSGGITVGKGVQNLAFASAKLSTPGDVVFSGEGMLGAQGDLTLSSARVTADKTARHGVDSQGLVTIEKAAKTQSFGEQVGAGGSLALTGQRVKQAGFIDLPSGSLSITGRGQSGKTDTVLFAETSITQAKGWVAQAGTNWSASAQGGQIKATALSGDVVVKGTLDVSAPVPTSSSDTAKSAGAIALMATAGALRVGELAQIKGSAASVNLSGTLTVDAKTVANEAPSPTNAAAVVSAAAAQGTLDRLINAANVGGLHGGVDVRVREGDLSLNTTLKAVRASLSADTGALTLMGSAKIDATAPQGGLVQLAAGKDLVVSAGAQIHADSSRAGANGGDVLLASTSGQVKLEEGAAITAEGDDALDGRVVIGMSREALAELVKDQADKSPESIKTASITAGEVDVVGNRVYQGETVGEGKSGSVYTETVTKTSTKVDKAVTPIDTTETATTTTTVTVNAYLTNPETGETVVQASDPQITVSNPVVTQSTTAPGTKPGNTSKTTTNTSVATSNVGQYVGLADVADDAQTLMDQQGRVLSAMGLTGRANLRAGVEIRSSGDFYLNSDLSLADALHPGGQPVFLTVRAERNLDFRGSLSDGFSSAARNAPINAGEAASYRLIAGADTSAANVLKTKALVAGDITIGANRVVRTTSGSIEMAAAQDIILKTDYATRKTAPVQGVAYVAGRLMDLPTDVSFDVPPNQAAEFTSHGGRFEAMAGRDIVAPGTSQMFGAWFNHEGFDNLEADRHVPVAWWTTLSAFKQGFGSFGGGNVQVMAGRDISNLGVVAPTSARVLTTTVRDEATGKVTSQHADLVVENGGDVNIQAGRDVRGGSFFIGQGNGLVHAGGAIATGDSLDTTKMQGVGVILGQMDGNWLLQAVQDVNLALNFNPTMYFNAARTSATGGMYLTYGEDSALAMSSVSGDVNWWAASRIGKGTGVSSGILLAELGKLGETKEQLKNSSAYLNASTGLTAPVVHLAALQGNVLFDLPPDAIILTPSATGDLSIYANQDVRFRSAGKGSLNLGEALISDSYTLLNPKQESVTVSSSGSSEAAALLSHVVRPSDNKPGAASFLHAQDKIPVRVYAGRDLIADSGSLVGRIKLSSSKAADIVAGRDILNLSFIGQNLSDTDVTSIAAGRNFVGASNAPGINRPGGLISLSGPGELQVEAGAQMDLNTSAGIETVGNQYNAALPDQGASIRLAAGTARTVDVTEFADAYLAQDTAAQAKLVRYVKETLMLDDKALADYPATDGAKQAQVYAKALAYYQALTPQHQLTLADEVVTDAFVAHYLSGQGAFAAAWQAQAAKAGVSVADRTTSAFKQFKDQVVMTEVKRLGGQAIAIADSTDAAENAKRKAQRQALWDQIEKMSSLAGLGKGFDASGDIDLAGSMVYTNAPGNFASGGIDLFAPGGQVIVGFNTLTANDKLQASSRGLVAMQGGSIRAFSEGDFQVNSQKTFVVGEGDVIVYSAEGSIDSGRGSNTDVTIPRPRVSTDPATGIQTRTVSAATTGSGIGRLNAGDVLSKGEVMLIAPKGEIRALDAFIRNESGGDVLVGGQAIIGGDNIKGNVSGLAPAPTVSLSLNVNSALPTDAGVSAQAAVDTAGGKKAKDPSSILTVDLLGVGEEGTAPAAAPVATPDAASTTATPSASATKPCPKEGCKR